MSYCRWSSDNWKCDLYAYEDASGGWTIHVAAKRRVGEIPDDRFTDFLEKKITAEEWVKLHTEQLVAVGAAPLEDIDLPLAGEDFYGIPTLGEFKEKLLELRRLGYHFPEHVLEMVNGEIESLGEDFEGEDSGGLSRLRLADRKKHGPPE